MVDIQSHSDTITQLEIRGQLKGEIAFVITQGGILNGTECVKAGQMLISKTADECQITLEPHTRLLLFGGQPFPEPRYLYWNFVSSSKKRLEQAKNDWQNKHFPKVPNDTTYIPLPR